MGGKRRRGETKRSGGSLECGKSRVDAHAVSPSLSTSLHPSSPPSLPPSLAPSLTLPPSLARSHTHMLTHSASLQQRKPIGWSQKPKHNPLFVLHCQ